MRQGKGGDHFHNFLHRAQQAGHRHPLATLPCDDSGQQQCQQKQNVVVTNPDVPDAFNHILAEGLPSAGRLQGQGLFGGFSAEDQRLRCLWRAFGGGRDPLHQAAV